MTQPATRPTPAMIRAYVERRLTPPLTQSESWALTAWLVACPPVEAGASRRGRPIPYRALSLATGIDIERLRGVSADLRPILVALDRPVLVKPPAPRRRRLLRERPARVVAVPMLDLPLRFPDALRRMMASTGDSPEYLAQSLTRQGVRIAAATLRHWRSGAVAPSVRRHERVLAAIAERYDLPAETLVDRLTATPPPPAAILDTFPKRLRDLAAWHLPPDYAESSEADQAAFRNWFFITLGNGATDYRRFLQAQRAQPYGLTTVAGADRVHAELDALMAFKSEPFVAIGYQRSGVWNHETAVQKRTQLEQLFGALAAARDGPAQGLGVKPQSMTLALLLFPAVWDAWLRWREARRGFYIQGEADLLRQAMALVRPGTGWLRQSSHLKAHLRVIRGLVSKAEIAEARLDWTGACDRLLVYARGRARDIARVCRVHRDPFEPILPVLDAESPVGVYRRITDEIVARMPDARRHPIAAAEAVRACLLLRLGLHTGLRQRNLRELRLCPRGQRPTPERKLEAQRCGELRWHLRDAGWEVVVPAGAFKNAGSSFFAGRPFRVLLPDIGGLYGLIAAWVTDHRAILLGAAKDPSTLFIATARGPARSVALTSGAFYHLWRDTVARYGIYNPFTGKGAVRGLLPHGPHNVRDVLATHILKQTGSFEHAGYAIQDTAETVARHYGRFLPQDKSALAAQIVNRVWQEDP